jgi:hypothetical protein
VTFLRATFMSKQKSSFLLLLFTAGSRKSEGSQPFDPFSPPLFFFVYFYLR